MRECVTHHHACDCREAKFKKLQAVLTLKTAVAEDQQERIKGLVAENTKQAEQIEGLREALKFYADREKYWINGAGYPRHAEPSFIDEDEGKIARQAIQKSETTGLLAEKGE